jgi:hypothetical protein
MADDAEARKERAKNLHEEIEALKSGRPPRPPSSDREFVEERMHELDEAEPDQKQRPEIEEAD